MATRHCANLLFSGFVFSTATNNLIDLLQLEWACSEDFSC